MALGEFQLIDRFFRPLDRPAGVARADVLLGVGDDGALLRVPSGQDLVAVLDTLVQGTHFLPGCAPRSIGHRALAVNLSDLAAMGATPAWALLGLTLPAADEALLQGMAEGLGQLAAEYGVALVGGDTTAGPLALTVQAMGFVPPGQALQRRGARPGDLLCVSGTLGDSAAGLALERGAQGGLVPDPALLQPEQWLRQRFLFPQPRVALGQALRGLATACIDVSDGLAQDAGKLASASGCGLRLDVAQLPLSAALRARVGLAQARHWALTGGEDFELCFALPPTRQDRLLQLADAAGCALQVIGRFEAEPGLRLVEGDQPLAWDATGFEHFTAGD